MNITIRLLKHICQPEQTIRGSTDASGNHNEFFHACSKCTPEQTKLRVILLEKLTVVRRPAIERYSSAQNAVNQLHGRRWVRLSILPPNFMHKPCKPVVHFSVVRNMQIMHVPPDRSLFSWLLVSPFLQCVEHSNRTHAVAFVGLGGTHKSRNL